jgi:hypothetical protein
LLLANAVQFDVSSVLNSDVVLKYNQSLGGILPALAPVDQNLPGGDWSFLTQSAANQPFLAPAGTTGLVDSGFFGVDAFHPDVQLHYGLFDQGDNARRQEEPNLSSFAFTVPAVAYDQLHFFVTAGSGPSAFQVQATYADGTTTTSGVFNVPDWYSPITESSAGYYLASGLSRISPNGSSFDYNNPNHFSIFGFEYDPDPSKVLQSITIQPTAVSGTFVFFGATGVTDTTYLGSSGRAIATAEGQAINGTIASFTAANANALASDFTATIAWGDGAVTTGTITATGGGQFVVTGNHVYTEAGSDPISAVIQESTTQAAITAASTANVTDVPLNATAAPLTAVEGTALTAAVACFSDANRYSVASDFTASIDWGDGHTSAGAVIAAGPGRFLVIGSNTYAVEGSYTVSVTINDVGGSAASTSGTLTVTDAPLSTTPTPVATTEGAVFTGAVASFTDGNPNSTASDFTPTITWGDGQTSIGTVTATGPGSFQVVGSNTYAEEGSYPVSVSITDVDGSTASSSGTASVADAPLQASAGPVSATEGAPFSGVVASFTDANLASAASDFTATITWGDGQTSAGTVNATGLGGFQVSGSNTYAEEGSYTVSVTITDVGGSTTSTSGTATGTDAPLSASAVPVAATEGAAFTGAVASFTDGNPDSATSDFTAIITWGDGQTSAGTVTATAPGSFLVLGSNTYSEDGSYAVSVAITDAGGSGASVSGTASVADAALTARGTTVPATEGTTFSGVVASFTDDDPNSTAGNFSAIISWGDGHTSAGTVTATGPGRFQVSGSNTYAEEGDYAIQVTITDVGGSTARASGSAGVADAPLLARAVGAGVTEGSAFTGAVASFTDGDTASTAGDFSAIISWGDGHISTGTVTATGPGTFQVLGSNTYAEEGSYAVSVAITDGGGSGASTSGTASVADAPLSASAVPVTATEEEVFTGAVASFIDGNPTSTAGDFTAIISWGDGHTSAGTVTATSPGRFVVRGSNTYVDEGSYTVGVAVTDAGGSKTSISGTASVADAALTAAAVPVAATEGAVFSGVVAYFTDANPGSTASDFTATITWGDGHTSTGTLTAAGSGRFQVSGSNTYADEGSYAVSVIIGDVGGAKVSTSGTATVADVPLSASAVSVTATEGTAFSGVVASFTDGNPNSTASDFTATITWGDGHTSVGTVTATGSGRFQVNGSNTYAEDGSYAVGVTITDAGGSRASTSGTATVADAPLSATGVTAAAAKFTPFTGVVATFTDADLGGNPADYTATISWGDGTSSSGIIAYDSVHQVFTVTGSHTYSFKGIYAVTVVITDDEGNTPAAGDATATASSTVTVGNRNSGNNGAP